LDNDELGIFFPTMNFFGCYVGWERANNRTMDENRANWEI